MPSPDPLQILWTCAHAEHPQVTTDEIGLAGGAPLPTLLKLGLFIPGPVAQMVVCDACDDHHAATVITLPGRNGPARHLYMCPENGPQEVAPERLVQYRPDFERFLEWVAHDLGIPGAVEPVIPDLLWRLGRASIAGKSRDVWCLRGWAWAELEISPRLPKSKGSVIFTLAALTGIQVPGFDDDHVIGLQEVVRLEGEALRLDVDGIQTRLRSGAPPTEEDSKRFGRRHKRAVLVDQLKKALHEHLLAARSHAKNLEDQGRESELLPRPTLQGLARQLNSSKPSVHRALNDGDKYLEILWETAGRVEAVLKYRG